MATQTILEDRQQYESALGLHLVMTAISLAVIAGFVLWQVWPDGGQPSAPAADRTAASAGAEEIGPRGGVAEMYEAERTATRSNNGLLLIVESEAQARSMRTFAEALAAANVGLWKSDSDRVIWFESDESEARFWQLHSEGDAFREQHRLPRLTVVDLRRPAPIEAPSQM